MHGVLRVTVVALCLALAGCGGFVGGPDQATPVTPAPVPTPDPGTVRVAPGLTEAGVDDADALTRAHVAVLSNRSYTVDRRRLVETADGTVRLRQDTRVETAAGYDAYRASSAVAGTAVSNRTVRTHWEDGRAVQWTTANGTTDRRIAADSRGIGGPPLPPRDALSFDPTFNQRIRTLFGAVNVTNVSLTNEEIMQLNQAPLYRVSTEGATDRTRIPVVTADRVGGVSFTATVTPNGVVRSYALQYTVVRDGTTLRVTESVRYSDVGTTTVPVEK
ncbi:hypothetical protein ACFQL1_11880 [Halomicroarcula sp. GCM10025709]|uniref:hypothetical protein n=1 Tax=Haloarcula TaxID=2237 RepID=UPI0024C304A6|nr:hypothetical protein [Halomicroarcula sp. YJ-61-S]